MGKNRRKRNIRRLKKAFRRNKTKILIGAAAAVLLLIVCVSAGFMMRGCSGTEQTAPEENSENVDADQMIPESGNQPSPEVVTEEIVETLSKNSYYDVNEIVARYFTALQGGDGETLMLLRDNTEAKELLRMQLNGQYIEAYKNLDCYTKSGLGAESYVVFAYYEVKFVGHETLLPGITPLYVCKNEEGEFYLHDLTIEDEVSAYVAEIAGHDDVKALYEQVGTDYQNALAQDEALSAFVTEYAKKMKETVGVALEEENQAQNGETAAETPDGNSVQNEEAASGNGVPDSGAFRVGDTLNVRANPSEDAERIGVCYEGETIEILMKQEDGWTKVKFNGKTGYIKTSVLK